MLFSNFSRMNVKPRLTCIAALLALLLISAQVFTVLYITSADDQTACHPHAPRIASEAISLDGKLLLSSWSYGEARLWNIEAGNLSRTFYHDHDFLISAVAISDDSRFAATSDGYSIKVWEIDSGELLQTFFIEPSEISVFDVRFFPDNLRLLITTMSGKVSIRNITTGLEENSFIGDIYTAAYQSVELSPHGQYLAIPNAGSLGLALWNLETGQIDHAFDNITPFMMASFLSDTEIVLNYGTTLEVWNIETGQSRPLVYLSDRKIQRWEFTPGNEYILIQDNALSGDRHDTRVVVWDLVNHELLYTLDANSLDLLTLLDEGSRVVLFEPALSLSKESTLSILSIPNQSIVTTFDLRSSFGDLIAANSTHLVIVNELLEFELWDIQTGQFERRLC